MCPYTKDSPCSFVKLMALLAKRTLVASATPKTRGPGSLVSAELASDPRFRSARNFCASFCLLRPDSFGTTKELEAPPRAATRVASVFSGAPKWYSSRLLMSVG